MTKLWPGDLALTEIIAPLLFSSLFQHIVALLARLGIGFFLSTSGPVNWSLLLLLLNLLMDSHIHTYKYKYKYKYKYVETQILNINSWFVNWAYPYNFFVDSKVLHFAAIVSKNVFPNILLLCIICVLTAKFCMWLQWQWKTSVPTNFLDNLAFSSKLNSSTEYQISTFNAINAILEHFCRNFHWTAKKYHFCIFFCWSSRQFSS